MYSISIFINNKIIKKRSISQETYDTTYDIPPHINFIFLVCLSKLDTNLRKRHTLGDISIETYTRMIIENSSNVLEETLKGVENK